VQTLDRIRHLAATQFGGDPLQIDVDAPIQQLGADSLGYLEFLFELEEQFDISIDQDEAKQVRTLHDLGMLIDRLVETKVSSLG
jgi:acyl carrier protein